MRRSLLANPLEKLCFGIVFLLVTGTSYAQSDPWRQALSAGNAALSSGNLEQAESRYKEALALAEHFGGSDPRLFSSLNSLALAYEEEKKYEQARPLLQRLL